MFPSFSGINTELKQFCIRPILYVLMASIISTTLPKLSSTPMADITKEESPKSQILTFQCQQNSGQLEVQMIPGSSQIFWLTVEIPETGLGS